MRTHSHFIVRPMRWVAKTPVGWTLMAYERNGKMVCRFFYTEPRA